MNLAFLVPAFLLGLAAVVVPIVVHLRHRERKDPVRFPSLMFLSKVPHRSVRRRRITHPLLLLLRGLAVGALVLAFARPFWERPPERPLGGNPDRAIIVVVDRSMSMGYQGVWAKAQAAALAAFARKRPDDRVALIAFDDQAEVIAPLDADPAAATSRLTTMKPGGGGTRLAPALRLARDLAAQARGLAAEIVLVSDLQKQATTGLEVVEQPPGARLEIVSVAPDKPTNASVLGVEVNRTVEGKRNLLEVGARFAVKGGTATRTGTASLTVNGRKAGELPVKLAPNSSPAVRFQPVSISEGDATASVELDPDLLPADDTLRFTLGAATGLHVALLLPSDSKPDETVYLERALSLSQAPRLAIETFRGSVPTDGLSRAASVVVSDWGAVGPRMQATLEAFVRRGGGLLAFAGSRSRESADRSAGWLPARIGRTLDRSADRGGTLGYLNRDHAAFEPFRDALATDFGAARFFRYHDVIPDSAADVVGRFDDGRPAIAERSVGAGRMILVATASDAVWTDLPLQPVFLPLVHRLVGYVSKAGAEQRSYAVGDALPLPTHADASVRDPTGATHKIEADTGLRTVALGLPGFYQIEATDHRAEHFAVNPPTSESDLAVVSPADVELLVRRSADSLGPADPAATLTPTEQERTQSWWVYLLGAALVLLGIEAMYAGRLARRERAIGGVV